MPLISSPSQKQDPDCCTATTVVFPGGKLVRGLFTVDVAADRSSASLVSTVEAFSDDDGKPWFGTLDYFP